MHALTLFLIQSKLVDPLRLGDLTFRQIQAFLQLTHIAIQGGCLLKTVVISKVRTGFLVAPLQILE